MALSRLTNRKIPKTRKGILEVKMSKLDELRALLKANIASGDISKTTIERIKAEIIAAELEEISTVSPYLRANLRSGGIV